MGSSRVKQKNPSNQLGLNPNWAQLQQVPLSLSLSLSLSVLQNNYFHSFSLFCRSWKAMAQSLQDPQTMHKLKPRNPF